MKTNKTNATVTTTTNTKAVEALETRTMMSVSGNIDAAGVMNVHATGGNDALHVEFTTKAVKIYDVSKASYGKGAPLLAQWSTKGTSAVKLFGDYGNDLIELGGYAGKPVHTYGGKGNDILVGGTGMDNLWGGPGADFLQGNGGNDYLYGEAGDDSLTGDGPAVVTPGNDFMSGGTGVDMVSYASAKAGVTLNLNNTYDNGVAGEHDGIYLDVENAAGSDYDDVIRGNALGNTIWGRKGNDSIHGMQGNDAIYGQAGNDTVVGGSGADLLVGGAGSDQLFAAMDDGVDAIWGGDKGVFSDGGAAVDVAKVGKVNGVWDQIKGGVEQVVTL
jgi:Ca2+-binding RTX toxin-like protein